VPFGGCCLPRICTRKAA